MINLIKFLLEGSSSALNLHDWSIKEVIHRENKLPTRHLIGFFSPTFSGQVTMEIKSFNTKRMIIETYSGKCYKRCGQPGHHHKVESSWEKWKKNNKVESEQDVTNEYLTNKS